MSLDSLREMLRAASAVPLHDRSVAEARLVQAAEPTDPVAPDDLEVTELASPVPIRLFRPRSPDPVPVCVWFSGGGWVLDTRAASESSCRRLARETPCAVALVGYRLAPEHRFPVPLEDCFAATGYVVADGATNGLDARRIAVGGTSAGGNLAAAVALLARDRPGVRLAAQILVYPALLHGADTASMRESYAPGELDRRGVDWCWSHYLASAADGLDPLASPLLADDLRGLPRRSCSPRSSIHSATRVRCTHSGSRLRAFEPTTLASTGLRTGSSPRQARWTPHAQRGSSPPRFSGGHSSPETGRGTIPE